MAGDLRTLQIGNDWFGERQGGLGRHYSQLLKYLPRIGVRVRGLVAGSLQVESETAGVVRGFAPPQAPLYSRLKAARQAALQVLREENIDVIASHFALYTVPLLDRLRRKPIVIHFHGPWAAETGIEQKSFVASMAQAVIERRVYRRGQRIIVLSAAFAEEIMHRYKIPEAHIRIVPGGVDPEWFSDRLTRVQAREQLQWPIDRPIVLAVRRHVRRMGLENLIDATRQIRQRVPDVLVLLAGAGPISGELRQRIADHGLEEHVRLLGRLPDTDLALAYRAADLSVVPSQTLEGFGMITLESLASGTPVLVAPVGGLPEVVRPFSPECVFENTTPAAMSDLIRQCLLGQLRLPSSSACREYAVTKFSWPVIAQQTRNVYEEALR